MKRNDAAAPIATAVAVCFNKNIEYVLDLMIIW